MNKKNIYIIIIVLVMIIAGLSYYYFANKNKLPITTTQGTVKINDINKNPVQTFPNSDVEYKTTTNYTLDYYAKDKSFIITLTNSNIQMARNEAEAGFLSTLKISKEQACQLNVQLGVPFSYNVNNSGINFGLSFCPNGKSFNQ
jgi:uncharacterized protein YxeA